MSTLDPWAGLAVTTDHERTGLRLVGLARRLGVLERKVPRSTATSSDYAWHDATLAGGHTQLTGYAPVGYYRDALGRVFCRGGVNHGVTIGANATIFTLAAGFRPAYKRLFIVAADDAAGDRLQWVTVNTNGTVVANQAGTEGGELWLDVVQFRTA